MTVKLHISLTKMVKSDTKIFKLTPDLHSVESTGRPHDESVDDLSNFDLGLVGTSNNGAEYTF